MNREFLERCTAIAPLLEGDEHILDVSDIAIPGVSPHVARVILGDVLKTDQSARAIGENAKHCVMSYCLAMLKMGEFLGHEGMISAAASVIASRLEGMTRDGMRASIGHLDDNDFTPDQMQEIEQETEWISQSMVPRDKAYRCSIPNNHLRRCTLYD